MSDRTDSPTSGPSPAPDPIGQNPTGRPRRSSAGTRRRKAKGGAA